MITQDSGEHEIDPELAHRVANFLKERQDRIITLWSGDMAVIDDRASKAVHRDAISSFLSLMIERFEHTDTAKSPNELTKALTGKYNIKVNSISPGLTETPMVQSLKKKSPKVFEERNRRIPLGRPAQIEDVVNLVTFLVSPESDYISGQDIIIDGNSNEVGTNQ